MKAYPGVLILLSVVAGASAGHAAMDAASYDRGDALAISQGAIGKMLGDYTLRDTNGQPFSLSSLRGKPVVISMIYTSCHHICPSITRNLGDTIEVAQEALGEDTFSVVTVGFDWRVDTPDRMREFESRLGVSGVPNWHFLATEAQVVDDLSNNLGFLFFTSAKGFDHLAQATVIDADGRVYRQVYGVDVETTAVVEPLLGFGVEDVERPQRGPCRALAQYFQAFLHRVRPRQRSLPLRLFNLHGNRDGAAESRSRAFLHRQGMAARPLGPA